MELPYNVPEVKSREIEVLGHRFKQFERESFPPELHSLIPKGRTGVRLSAQHWKVLVTAANLSARKSTPGFFFGPTGSGKTLAPEMFAALTRRPFFKLLCDAHMEVSMAFTTTEIRSVGGASETRTLLGPVGMAMVYGGLVVLDEIDHLPPALQGRFQGALEVEPGSIYMTDSGDRIPVHPAFMAVATGNTNGHGDTTGIYPGCYPLNAALIARFLSCEVNYLPADKEKEVVVAQTGVREGFAVSIVDLANRTRGAVFSGSGSTIPLSTRSLVAWAHATRALSGGNPKVTPSAIRDGFKMAFFATLPGEEDREFYATTFEAAIGIPLIVEEGA